MINNQYHTEVCHIIYHFRAVCLTVVQWSSKCNRDIHAFNADGDQNKNPPSQPVLSRKVYLALAITIEFNSSSFLFYSLLRLYLQLLQKSIDFPFLPSHESESNCTRSTILLLQNIGIPYQVCPLMILRRRMQPWTLIDLQDEIYAYKPIHPNPKAILR